MIKGDKKNTHSSGMPRNFTEFLGAQNLNFLIDLTCELTEPMALRRTGYHSFPILDGDAPKVDQLREWAAYVAALPGNAFIHCAEGHGRTGLLVSALLLTVGHCRKPDDAIQFIQPKRTHVRLARQQLRILNEAYKTA